MKQKELWLWTLIIGGLWTFSQEDSIKWDQKGKPSVNPFYSEEKYFEKYKEVLVDENTHPGYKTEFIKNSKGSVMEYAVSRDGSRAAAILDIYNTHSLFVVDWKKRLMREASRSLTFFDKHPAITADGGKTFFTSPRFGNQEIWMVEWEKLLEGTSHVVDPVIFNKSENTHPAVDAQGMVIAYISTKNGFTHLYLRNLMTGKELSPSISLHECSNPELSYQGGHLVYTSLYGNNHEIFYCDLIQNPLLNINISDHNKKDTHPAISADGRRVVFQSDRSGRDGIYMVDMATAILYNLTYFDKKYNNRSPSISADGEVIAYQSIGKWETPCVKVMDFRRKLIFKIYTKGRPYFQPILSKDGKNLMFRDEKVVQRVALEELKDTSPTTLE